MSLSGVQFEDPMPITGTQLLCEHVKKLLCDLSVPCTLLLMTFFWRMVSECTTFLVLMNEMHALYQAYNIIK